MSGFSKLFWGFLFFFDFRLQGVDVLPDFIGYLFFYAGLSALATKSLHFVEANKYTIPLVVLSLFDIYQVQQPIDSFHFSAFNFAIMLIGLIGLVLDLLVVFHITSGIGELAQKNDDFDLKNKALTRWKYYLFIKLASYFTIFLVFIVPNLLIMLIIPIFIIGVIVFILMMMLMKQADETFCNSHRRLN